MNKEIITGGKKIVYRVFGTGNPVMLIHGFGETGDVWKNQIEFLREHFLLIVPELPGSGQSEITDVMSIEGMAEVMKKILDAEIPLIEKGPATSGADKIVMIGHSMGGYITLAFAEKYPAYLRAFGLFHSTAFADTDEKKVTRQKAIGFITQNGGYEFLKTATPALFSASTVKENPELVQKFVGSLSGFSGDPLIDYYVAMMQRLDRVSVLKNTVLPVLFIMGEYDNAVAIQDVLKQCHLPQKSYIYILTNSGHMGMLEEPGKCNRILKNFLQEI